MGDVVTLPASGELMADARGAGRFLRVTWHHEADLVVLSLWRQDVCAGTFRLPRAEVPHLVQVLIEGLAVTPSGPGRRDSPLSP
ncbi:MAG: hypothetical protein ACRDV1_03090 [Actinomycetes bacterium]